MFKKYSEIENTYQDKFIYKVRNEHPSADQMLWSVTEKLHGANVQFEFAPGSKIAKVGRRRDYIGSGDNFYNLFELMATDWFQHIIQAPMMRIADEIAGTVRFYAELLGTQKGVNYDLDTFGPLHFFAIRNDEEYISEEDFWGITAVKRLPTVPFIGIFPGLQKVLDFDVDNFHTHYNKADTEHGTTLAEGIVIKPYRKVLRLRNDKIILFKKKHPKFAEKQKGPKKKIELSSDVERYRELFAEYVNENRVQSVFSKEGPIKHKKQIGKYIKWLLEDAQKDFMKDHEEVLQYVSKGELRQVFNLGAQPAHLLMRHL